MTLTVTMEIKELLGLEEYPGVTIDICETVDGKADVIFGGEANQIIAAVSQLAKRNQ